MSANLAQLQTLVQQPAAQDFFKGLFARARLELTDTGERFTIHQEGGSVRVAEGFDGPDANLVVPLASQNLANLSAIFADRQVTGDETYRIVRFMLRPCLEASLQMPILQNDRLLRILGVDDWQQALLDPQGREDVPLTVHKTHGQWTVSEGYHGNPRRRLRLTAEQMLDFQRRLFKADEENSITGWLALAGWYVTWRDQLTVPAGS